MHELQKDATCRRNSREVFVGSALKTNVTKRLRAHAYTQGRFLRHRAWGTGCKEVGRGEKPFCQSKLAMKEFLLLQNAVSLRKEDKHFKTLCFRFS